MSEATLPLVGPYASAAPGRTAAGASTLRRALGRLETIASLALATSVLVLLEGYLSWSGVLGKIPGPGEPWNFPWVTGVQIGLGIALALAIAVLVIVIIVSAVLGFIAWRRGVLAMVAASPEFGPNQVEACQKARKDFSTTLWLFLVLILAAIVVSLVFVSVNGALAMAGAKALPGTLVSVATSLATGSVLVAIYYYGTRHLLGLLASIATPAETSLLFRGRERMIAGAVVGLGAAFTSVSWVFDAATVVSLVIILAGVLDLARAYDLWLAEHRAPPLMGPAPGLPAV